MTFSWREIKRRLFRRKENRLLDQLFMVVETSLQKIKADKKAKGAPGLIEKIDKLLQGERRWRTAHQIELLTIPLLTDTEISAEMEQKLIHARKHFDQDVYRFYAAKSKTGDRSEKRTLLSQLSKDLQWHHELENIQLDYVKSARIKTSLLFIISFIFFMFPQITSLLFAVPEGTRNYNVLTALLSGWLGATFSMLLGLKRRIMKSTLGHLKVICRLDFIIARTIIGMFAGLILFYLFEAEMISGPFFPLFGTLPLDPKNFALLIIWTFLAGFSEKLVPDVLTKSEKLGSTGEKPGDSRNAF